MFFIINIARSQHLLYNTGRTALIVHNVQGVVLSFDFSCVSVIVDVLCFHQIQSCLVNSTYDIVTFPGVFYFYFGSDITFVNSNHMCTIATYTHSKRLPISRKTNNKNRKKNQIQYNVKDKKLKQYNPPQKSKQKSTLPPNKNQLSQ